MRQHELEHDIAHYNHMLSALRTELAELDKPAIVAYYKSYTGVTPKDEWSLAWGQLSREEKDKWRNSIS